MNRFLAFLALAAVCTSAAFANALDAAPTAEAREPQPPDAQVIGLHVQPAQIKLTTKLEAVQLVVTAKLTGGALVDVTRGAKIDTAGLANISAKGQLTPKQDGAGTLRVSYAGHQAKVPIEVAGTGLPLRVDFIRDVNPVMTQLGCNAGTCHGAKDGKVGFKLSLRGYDPIFDVRSLKDDLAARRLNVASPDDSLMLLKSTAGVPHEGGQKTKPGEKYYEILRTWIADGAKLDLNAPRVAKIEVAPQDPVVQTIGARQQMRVVATYTDGATRDVTAEAFVDSGNIDVVASEGGGLIKTLRRGEAPVLARYEGAYAATTVTVMGDRSGFVWQQPPTFNRIDELVAAKWQRMAILPSELCNDPDFLRRVYLDLTGLPPSAEEVRAFLADTGESRAKRKAVIDRLIGSPDFIEHWTNKWADMLQVNSKFLGKEGAKGFRDWIRKEVEANTPYDDFVHKILTATGSNRENPPASYFKVLREPAETMENTTHLFLATRFNCNKCHDHPFERWTQDQYYKMAAFFAQTNLAGDPASGKAVVEGTAVDKAKPLYEIVSDKAEGEVKHDRTGKVSPPDFPFPAKFETKEKPTRREQLAAWMTSADNRYFAASYVNRLWGYMTGVGIIEPLDDIRAGNPPSNPELLDFLTKEFIAHGFDARHVLRLICQSRTYQLALTTNRWNEDDKTNYSHALPRRLPAEVLYDAVLRVAGSTPKIPGVAPGTRAAQIFDAGIDLPSGFLANLGRPARESACECERSSDLRLGSVMALLSGGAVADAIGDPQNALAKLVAEQPDDRKVVDELFVRTLNRSATDTEIQRTLAAWGTIGGEHATLTAAWEAKEKEQAPIIAQMEKDRLAAIDAAKAELARHEQEIAPKIADAEKKRLADLATAEKAVKDYEVGELAKAQANFEATVPAARTHTGWQPLALGEIRATNGVVLTKQPDGSLAASGALPKSTEFVVKCDTKLAEITGILLEVLPAPDAPQFGPGRHEGGNFVLGELAVKANALNVAEARDVELADAIADFSQENFGPKKAIDGKRNDRNNGWAIAPQVGVPHYLAVAFKQPLGDSQIGTRLRVELNQPFPDGGHIARFRLWATTSAVPLNLGLPAQVAEALKKSAPARNKDEQANIAEYWNAHDPELRKRRLAQGKHQLPLPTDPGIVTRRAALAKAEQPIRLDPQLAQLRADLEQSKTQLTNQRLTGAQDLVWALVNTPAFLFNR